MEGGGEGGTAENEAKGSPYHGRSELKDKVLFVLACLFQDHGLGLGFAGRGVSCRSILLYTA